MQRRRPGEVVDLFGDTGGLYQERIGRCPGHGPGAVMRCLPPCPAPVDRLVSAGLGGTYMVGKGLIFRLNKVTLSNFLANTVLTLRTALKLFHLLEP